MPREVNGSLEVVTNEMSGTESEDEGEVVPFSKCKKKRINPVRFFCLGVMTCQKDSSTIYCAWDRRRSMN